MKKAQLEALGLTKEQVREVQRLSGLDMQKWVATKNPASNEVIRAAIVGLLPLIRSPIHLNLLMSSANHFYYIESKPERAEGALLEAAPENTEGATEEADHE